MLALSLCLKATEKEERIVRTVRDDRIIPASGNPRTEERNPEEEDDARQYETLLISSNRRGANSRAIRIAKTLNRNGYAATILSWDRTGELPSAEDVEGVRIENFRFRLTNDGGIPVLLIGYLFWWIHLVRYLLRSDASLYHAENLYSAIPVAVIKAIRRKHMVYDLVDYSPDSFNWSRLTRAILSWLENVCLVMSDGIIVMDMMKQQINPRYVRRISEIPNCPEDLRNTIEPLRSDGKFTIYYGGWIAETRGIRQISLAINRMPDVKLVIAGSGGDEPNLRRTISQDNVQFMGPLTNLESLRMAAASDLVFAFYDPAIPINRFAVSAKVPEAMMLGKPILGNSESALVAAIIEREECGIHVPYNDIDAIRASISKLKNDRSLLTRLGENSRRAFERQYNWPAMEGRLMQLYQSSLGVVRCQ